MAKADTTIADGVWLRDALEIATKALGSKELAKARILKWLAPPGELPWEAMSWQAHDAEDIVRKQQFLKDKGIAEVFALSGPYHEGDPAFWGCKFLQIDWEDNSAREVGIVPDGAQAHGIRVSEGRLRALLPAEAREAPQQVLEQPKVPTKRWFDGARKMYPPKRNEQPVDYAKRLHRLMEKAPVVRLWVLETVKRRLRD
jgi:hypothetical protein